MSTASLICCNTDLVEPDALSILASNVVIAHHNICLNASAFPDFAASFCTTETNGLLDSITSSSGTTGSRETPIAWSIAAALDWIVLVTALSYNNCALVMMLCLSASFSAHAASLSYAAFCSWRLVRLSVCWPPLATRALY